MIKNIILFILFCLFFLNVNAAEKQDCSVLKKLSKDYWICKKNNLKGSDVFIAIIGICAFCSAMGSLIGGR